MINNTLIFNEKSCTSSEESFLFNEKDTVLGAPLSDWETGKTNILFVTGFSGSGKSTISRESKPQIKQKSSKREYVDPDRDAYYAANKFA